MGFWFLFSFSQSETDIYLDKIGTFSGAKYKKIIYHQYYSITVTKQAKRNQDEKHLDKLGTDSKVGFWGLFLVLRHERVLHTLEILLASILTEENDYNSNFNIFYWEKKWFTHCLRGNKETMEINMTDFKLSGFL